MTLYFLQNSKTKNFVISLKRNNKNILKIEFIYSYKYTNLSKMHSYLYEISESWYYIYRFTASFLFLFSYLMR